ncbi:hypothetical protein C1701_00990 [Actinoalloteichus sp. AHMU CJ021]|nr:hypothetical protein C1701_00990 [Actinoalloteichus sp. AHMU CJ021]
MNGSCRTRPSPLPHAPAGQQRVNTEVAGPPSALGVAPAVSVGAGIAAEHRAGDRCGCHRADRDAAAEDTVDVRDRCATRGSRRGRHRPAGETRTDQPRRSSSSAPPPSPRGVLPGHGGGQLRRVTGATARLRPPRSRPRLALGGPRGEVLDDPR